MVQCKILPKMISIHLKKTLKNNKVWPYKIKGVIFVVDGYGEPKDHNFWAVGSLEVNGEEDQISIHMDTNTKVDVGIDIDSQETYILTLKKSLDDVNYPVAKIEKTVE